MKVSIVIVNFNSWDVLRPCLESIYRESTGASCEVIVVDNASTDGSVQHIREEFPHVRLICCETNTGFAPANNRGFGIAAGEYILMLNPDTVILNGAIMNAASFLDGHKGAAIVGGRLYFPDRSLQYSLSAFPTVWSLVCETFFLGKAFPGSRWFANFPLTHFRYDRDRAVDTVCGAFLMFRRNLLEEIGLLDEQFFMYSEEVDFCYRAKQTGHEVWFTPGAEIVHFWGGVSAFNRRRRSGLREVRSFRLQKHFHGVTRAALIVLKYLGVILRMGGFYCGGILLGNKHLLCKKPLAMLIRAARSSLARLGISQKCFRSVFRMEDAVENFIPASDRRGKVDLVGQLSVHQRSVREDSCHIAPIAVSPARWRPAGNLLSDPRARVPWP